MNILICGAGGFIGKNLSAALESIRRGYDTTHPELEIGGLYLCDIDTDKKSFAEYCAKADFIFDLMWTGRARNADELMAENIKFTSELLDILRENGNTCPVMFADSVQVNLLGKYSVGEFGESQKTCEEIFSDYGKESGARVLVYRLPEVFGKWQGEDDCSVVTAICRNVACGLPVQLDEPGDTLEMVYIDDLVSEMLRAVAGKETRRGNYCSVPVIHSATAGFIAETVSSFPALRTAATLPKLSDPLVSKLYSTWLSYLPDDAVCRDLIMHPDNRGCVTELIRTSGCGQVNLNVMHPGITKGNHWHNSKNEKFIVVRGEALIRLRRVGLDADGRRYPVVELRVNGEKLSVIDIVPGYTHSIANISPTEDLVTFMWVNECFDPTHPDTYFEEV